MGVRALKRLTTTAVSLSDSAPLLSPHYRPRLVLCLPNANLGIPFVECFDSEEFLFPTGTHSHSILFCSTYQDNVLSVRALAQVPPSVPSNTSYQLTLYRASHGRLNPNSEKNGTVYGQSEELNKSGLNKNRNCTVYGRQSDIC